MVGGMFAVWIMFADPGGEDGKGELNTALLGAVLMIPVIILVIVGIVVFLPVLLGIVLVIALAYGAYRAIRWFLASRPEGKTQSTDAHEEGMARKALRSIRGFFKRCSDVLRHSSVTRAMRERAGRATVSARRVMKETGRSLARSTRGTLMNVREQGRRRVREIARRLHPSSDERSAKKHLGRHVGDVVAKSTKRVLSFRGGRRHAERARRGGSGVRFAVTDVEDDGRLSEKDSFRGTKTTDSDAHGTRSRDETRSGHAADMRSPPFHDETHGTKPATLRERLQQWRKALRRKPQRQERDFRDDTGERRDSASVLSKGKKNDSKERSQAQDPLNAMRTIGWSTRRDVQQMYHRRTSR